MKTARIVAWGTEWNGKMDELAPLVVTLSLDDDAFGFFDALRQAHYPPKRNLLSAHLTLFHHLPGEQEARVAAKLRATAEREVVMPLRVAGVRSLGRGVAFTIESDALQRARAELTEGWAGWLMLQDRQPFRPHVTVQNKVSPDVARTLFHELTRTFTPFEAYGTGLDLWRYRGGLWESVGHLPFALPAG